MKVLHVECSLGSGGQAFRTMAEVQWLNRNGHEAWVACIPESWIFRTGLAAKLPVIPLTMPSSHSLTAMWKLSQIVRTLNCDVVHVHEALAAWVAAPLRLLGVPIVRSRHSTNPMRMTLSRRFSYQYACNHLVPTAKFTHERFLSECGIPADHMTVIGEGADLVHFNPNTDGSSFRLFWGAKPEDILFGCVGMLRTQKGQPILIEAAKRVLEKIPNARFILIGDNTDPAGKNWPSGLEVRTKYRKLIQEKFGYEPWLPENPICFSPETPILMHGHEHDVARATAALDVAVIPSLEEAQSKAAPEALCLGKPVIATRVGGLPEVVEHEKTGLLVPPNDPQALAEAMIRLAENATLRKQLGIIAAEEGRKRFSLDARMRETLEVYEKVLKK